MLDWLAHLYVGTLTWSTTCMTNILWGCSDGIDHSHVRRSFATFISGFSHCVDSLSAIKYAKVKPIRNENGIAVDFEIEGDFPRYGNDDDRADKIAVELLNDFMHKLRHIHTYRDSKATTSILTITSNVVYGKATGSLRMEEKPRTTFSWSKSVIRSRAEWSSCSLNSVAKLPYEQALDESQIHRRSTRKHLKYSDERIQNLVNVLDGYFDQGAHTECQCIREKRTHRCDGAPEKEEYANFTIRVSDMRLSSLTLQESSSLM